jgi:glycosyltransferase involved in cell wall biosynthesis
MRIAFLWYGLTGYLNACLKTLADLPEVEVFVAHKQTQVDSPFDEKQFGWIRNQFYWRTYDELPSVRTRIDDFRPDAIVMVGWNVKEYRAVSRAYEGKAVRIMTMDNNWMNTMRQRLGAFSASYRIQPYADAAWVPGERQAVFARKLGFHEEDIIRGLYSCDHAAFSTMYRERTEAGKPVPHNFLFVGRFVAEKGISVLVQAYAEYRSMVANPWTLTCCGSGPLQQLLDDRPGIQVEGFMQPSELPQRFGRAGCLVLPSTF